MRNWLRRSLFSSALFAVFSVCVPMLWPPVNATLFVTAAQAADLRKITGTFQGKGVQCPIMRDQSGNVYSLTTIPKGVKVGDRILVIGREMMFGTCMQGGLIAVEEVRKLRSDGTASKVWKIGKG